MSTGRKCQPMTGNRKGMLGSGKEQLDNSRDFA